MDIRHREGADGSAVVAISGELDLATAPRLIEALSRPQVEQASAVTVDLAGTDFIDSAGVRVLVEAARVTADAGAMLSVRGAHGWVAKVLEITGVSDYLNVQTAPDAVPGESGE